MQSTTFTPEQMQQWFTNREAMRPGPRPQGAYRPVFNTPQPATPVARPNPIAASRP